MHHRCSGSCHGTMVGGPCSCGLFYGHQSNSLSMIFSMPNGGYEAHQPYHQPYDEADMYSFESSSPSSSVDCTLSLGTPSTRLSNDTTNHEKSRRSNSRMSNFCWDILQSKHSSSNQSSHKSSRASNGASNSGSETLLARRCANCDTTSTPLWRNGPKGPKSLCNACGIRFKKEERRASAAAAAASSGNGGAPGAAVDAQHMLNSSWVHHHSSSQNQKMPYLSSAYGNEFTIVEDDDRDSDAGGIPYLSWRLNVTDRPAGLIHEFTR